MFWYNTLPVQLKPNDQSSVFEIPSVQKNALTNGLGAHICLLVKLLQGISAVEKIQSFQDVLKRLWTPQLHFNEFVFQQVKCLISLISIQTVFTEKA